MNWVYITAAATYLLGLLTTYIGRLYNLLWMQVRIPPESVVKVYRELNKSATYKVILNDSLEPTNEYSLPMTEQSIMKVGGCWIYSEITEKYLTAGFSGKETLYNISYLRFNRRKLIKIIEEARKKRDERETVTVHSTSWNNFVPVAQLRKGAIVFPTLEKDAEKKIIHLVDQFHQGSKSKAGILLYGPPGNGKTSIIRGLAGLLDYDIYIPLIKPESSNEDIIQMFLNIPKKEKCIILFEDFDSLFDRRYTRLANAKHTFDVFLNILDGLYADLSNKLIFITTNHLESIDDAIKNRPSRMDLCLEIKNPSYETRLYLTNSVELALAMEGMSYSTVQELVRRETPLEEIETVGQSLEAENHPIAVGTLSISKKKQPFAKYKRAMNVEI